MSDVVIMGLMKLDGNVRRGNYLKKSVRPCWMRNVSSKLKVYQLSAFTGLGAGDPVPDPRGPPLPPPFPLSTCQ